MKRGECAGRLGDAEAANALFDSAFRTYEAACDRADSAAGDDLGGLLHDWGCGPVAAAQTLADAARAVKDTNDARSAAPAPPRITRSRRGGEASTRVRVLRGHFAPLNASGERRSVARNSCSRASRGARG